MLYVCRSTGNVSEDLPSGEYRCFSKNDPPEHVRAQLRLYFHPRDADTIYSKMVDHWVDRKEPQFVIIEF